MSEAELEELIARWRAFGAYPLRISFAGLLPGEQPTFTITWALPQGAEETAA